MRPPFQWQTLPEFFTPRSLLADPEAARRARLIVGFGFVGSIFGPIYAAFYLFIDHIWGAAIILLCTVAMAFVPWLLKRGGSLALCGNLHALTLALGFSGLTGIEGGVHGHAIAWLASVPLCVLLLVGTLAAQVWCGICSFVVLFFCALEASHITAPVLYPARWHSAVTTAGFLGLVIFMSAIGLIFEAGRKRAFSRMQEALQELSTLNAQLIRSDAEKGEILGIAAHDLKNPLHEIIGFARLLFMTDYASAERVKRDASEILKASTLMHSLVSDLLDLQTIEEGRFLMNRELMDLADPVSAAVAAHRAMADWKQLKLTLKHPGEPVVIHADRGAILQILNNLISNAIKFSPQGREIFVTVRSDASESVVEVQDQGPGITPGDRAHLFEKFARLSARPTGGESSTGLGLSIVKRLVESMGGTVDCRCDPGEGATFSVHFPTVTLAEFEAHEPPTS